MNELELYSSIVGPFIAVVLSALTGSAAKRKYYGAAVFLGFMALWTILAITR